MKREASGKSAGKGLAHRLSVVLPLFAGAMLLALLGYLWVSADPVVWSSRSAEGFETVQDPVVREVEDESSPIGVAREYAFCIPSAERDACLAFYTVHQYAEVYVGGQLIYSLKPAGNLPVKTVGSNWSLIPLRREDAGKEILVRILPAYESVRTRQVTFLIGSQLAICKAQLAQDLPQLILSILLLFVGVVFLCVTAFRRHYKRENDGLAMLGLFSMMVGLWRLADTRFTPFLLPEKPVFLFYTSAVMLMAGVTPLVKSVETGLSRSGRRMLDWYCALAAAASLVLLALQVLGIRDLRENFTIIHLTIGIGVVLLLANVVCDRIKRRRDPTQPPGSWAALILVAGVAADTAAYYIRRTSSGLRLSLLALLIYFSVRGANLLFRAAEQEKQLAEAERQIAEQEHQLTESRMAIMMSQIKPHFIYNTLGSIEQLCEVQPDAAAQLVHNFSKYLRGNLGELDNPAPIRISREMEHVRCYVSIEKTRFPDITVNFDLQSEDFLLPALSVQPLVENAIKHGLMKLPEGGTVTVSTYETDTHYCVRVVDTGAGFDPATLRQDDRHVGLRNIRTRLETMCGGTLTVQSTPGLGTTVTIQIPREG